MLWYLCLVGERIDAGMVWGEATQTSCSFYSHVFNKNIRDLIVLEKAEYVDFSRKLKVRAGQARPNGSSGDD